jgi:biopolymer transport protein ExbD
MARKKRTEEAEVELNLAPIMNMVMILIPLILTMVEFDKKAVLNISSPQNAQSTTPEDEEREEETPVPKVVVYVSSDGFRIGNQNPEIPAEAFQRFASPIDGCPGGGSDASASNTPHDLAEHPATICLTGNNESLPLVQRLDYPSLYNRLAEIRLQPDWYDRFGEENNSVISLLADPEVPFEALVKAMDTARFFLEPVGSSAGPPSGASNIASYMLGGGGRPSLADLEDAVYIDGPGEGLDPIPMFPDPVLLLPRPGSEG